jgi:hypothetical protein
MQYSFRQSEHHQTNSQKISSRPKILEEIFSKLTWHRAIFAGSYPPTIFAATAFHLSVRDG